MTFVFGFGGDGNQVHESKKDRTRAPAHELDIQSIINEHDGRLVVIGERVDCGNNILLSRRCVSDVRFEVAMMDDMSGGCTDAVLRSVEQKSDLIAGVYEGGLKTWECSLDLVRCLSDMYASGGLEGRRVIEVGCGSGLPGIFCQSLLGAHVDFTDYNQGVLRSVTIPNILLNRDGMEGECELSMDGIQSRFFYGDWKNLHDHFKNGSVDPYDVVLTSETVYDIDTLGDLYELMTGIVCKGGIVLVAAKSIYFGCSGSLNDLLQLAQQDERIQSIDRIFVCEEHVKREVIKIQMK